MRLIVEDALAMVKFHGYPEIEITPSDVNAEAYKRGWNDAIDAIIESTPSIDAVPVVRCKDCKYQEKYFHEDRRRKNGGYYIYGCELADGYSHVCLDDDFCSRAERKESCIQEQ